MPNYKMFFKPAKGKDGSTYWEARSKSGKLRAQLFEADSNGIEFTMSLQTPRRQYRRRNNNSQMMQTIAMLKALK